MTRKPRKGDARRESGLTLRALRTFVAIVDAGSFSRTADARGVSQPSVSIQLNSLERACKVRLLHPVNHDYFKLLRAKLRWGLSPEASPFI